MNSHITSQARDLPSSDEEDDEDYVLPEPKDPSKPKRVRSVTNGGDDDSESDSDSGLDGEFNEIGQDGATVSGPPPSKKPKLDDKVATRGKMDSTRSKRSKGKAREKGEAVVSKEEDKGLSKEELDDIWTSFNKPDSPAVTAGEAESHRRNDDLSEPNERQKVKITTVYRFAGENIKEEKEVYKDSAEYQEWLKTQNETTTSTNSSTPVGNADCDPSNSNSRASPTSNVDKSTSASTSNADTTSKRGPPPRRRGGGLAAMAAGLRAGQQPQKLNTLEKSKLDWDKYVASSSSDLQSDLARQRKDGYLGRKDFLDRSEEVQQAKQDEERKRLRRLGGGDA